MRKIVLWLASAIVVTIIILAIILNAPGMREGKAERERLSRTYREFTHDLIGRDYHSAYALGGPEFKSSDSEEDFARAEGKYESKFGKLISCTMDSLEIQGDGDSKKWEGEIIESRTYERGTVRVRYEFHRESGIWLVFGYQEY